MGILVMVGYKPKEGKATDLEHLVIEHIDRLEELQLVTERTPIIGRAADGSIIEIFEWKSKEAIDEAHTHPEVQKLWERFEEVGDYVPLTDISGMDQLFAELAPIN